MTNFKVPDLPLTPDHIQNMVNDAECHALRKLAAPSNDLPELFQLNFFVRRDELLRTGEYSLRRRLTEITPYFVDVKMSTFTEIVDLYCDGSGRSVSIIKEMVSRKLGTDISYLAVWVICQYARRRRASQVPLVYSEGTWYLLQFQSGATAVPHVYILFNQMGMPIGLQLGQLTTESECALLHDGLALSREPVPATVAPSGVRLRLPHRLITINPLSNETIDRCAQIGIDVILFNKTTAQSLPEKVRDLQDVWHPLPSDAIKSEVDYAIYQTLLDTCDTTPLIQLADLREQSARGGGFNRDASLFPVLRNFLPRHAVIIDKDGILWQERRYHDDWLRHFDGESGYIQPSQEQPDRAWIYVGEETLCYASVCRSR